MTSRTDIPHTNDAIIIDYIALFLVTFCLSHARQTSKAKSVTTGHSAGTLRRTSITGLRQQPHEGLC